MAEQSIRPQLELNEALQTEEQKKRWERIKSLARGVAGSDDLAPLPQTVTELRLEEITNLMRHGEWERGQTDKVFAEVWGVAVSTVESLAAEASRILRRELAEKHEDVDDLKTDLRESFLRLARKAEAIGTPSAIRAAADALDKAGEYLGIKPPAKVQHVKDEFSGWTNEELQTFIDTGVKPKRGK
jgi:hypothetical protein